MTESKVRVLKGRIGKLRQKLIQEWGTDEYLSDQELRRNAEEESIPPRSGRASRVYLSRKRNHTGVSPTSIKKPRQDRFSSN